MRIILIRHGDPDYEKDFLTEKGEREAKCLARRIKDLDPEVAAYYSSPLGRAKETCRVCLEPLGKQPVILPWTEEYRGRTYDEQNNRMRIAWDYLPRDWRNESSMYEEDKWLFEKRFEGTNCEQAFRTLTEGFDAFVNDYGYTRSRQLRCVYETNSELKGKKDSTIVIFCHMMATMAMLSHVTGIAAPLMMHGFYSAPTGVTILQTEERVPGEAIFRVRCVGDTTHLTMGKEPISDAGFFPS